MLKRNLTVVLGSLPRHKIPVVWISDARLKRTSQVRDSAIKEVHSVHESSVVSSHSQEKLF